MVFVAQVLSDVGFVEKDERVGLQLVAREGGLGADPEALGEKEPKVMIKPLSFGVDRVGSKLHCFKTDVANFW